MICKNRRCKKDIPDCSKFCLYCGAEQITIKPRSKRPNGSGSVYKLSGKRKKPWAARAPKTQELIGTFETKTQATEAIESFKKDDIRPDKLSMTFESLFNEWKTISYKNISRQTQDNYNAAYKKLGDLYKMKFREIRTADMQKILDYYGSERQETDENNKSVTLPPMSHSSLTKIKALLTQLYDYALKNDIVSKNYATLITLAKQHKQKKDAFTESELIKIEKAIKSVPFADCILMMCYTGFRISEFLELKPSDYKDGFLIGGKKTDAGRNRSVPVHPKIKSYVDMWTAKGGQVIICKDNGEPYRSDYFRRNCYYPALEQIGIRKLTPHCCRHTAATRFAAAGMRPEIIIEILGHEDYDTTVENYIHPDAKTLKDELNKVK